LRDRPSSRILAPPMPRLALSLLLALAVTAPAAACSDYASVTARFAPDFPQGRHTVSVLGIFKDGQMSTDAWESIGARLSAPFGSTCTTGYAQLVATNQAASTAVDDYIRANGPGDEILEQLAPGASGDVVVVFTFAGHVSAKPAGTPDTGAMSSSPPGGSMGMGGGKYRGTRPGGSTGRGMARPANAAALEMSASFYSVAQKRSVGLVSLEYDGTSLDDAFQKFAAKISSSIPGSACAGWDFKTPVDEKKIRELTEH
jgi:hypothetical protein